MGIVESSYRKSFIRRYDDVGYLRYYSAGDFPELRDRPFSFLSGGNRLSAHWYSYDAPDEKELLVFCHGIGGGHRSYMKEIDCLCRRGYLVLAYDNTGCFASEGADIGCMSQSLADLDHCLQYLKKEGLFQRFQRVFVAGHSWGGYAAGNIAVYHPDVCKAVAISGFISVERLLEDNLGGVAAPLRQTVLKRLCAFERQAAPEYFDACTLESLKGSGTRYLFAHSTDDPMVSFDRHTGYLRAQAQRPDLRFLVYEDRKHNPNYTADAAAYMNGLFDEFNLGVKEGRLKTPEEKRRYFEGTDWDRMTAQDDAFWDEVAAFLEDP